MAITIYGKNTVREAIKNNRLIHELILSEDSNLDILEMANKKNIKVTILEKRIMNQKYKGNMQGIVARVEDYKYKDFEKKLAEVKGTNAVFLILDGLEDPHNLGAILRTCDATNIDAVIVPKNRSVKLNETVAKVSTGAIEYVDVIEVTNLVQTMKKLKDSGFWICGTDASADINHTMIEVDTSLGIIIGSEGFGMRRLVKENCDYLVKIPMQGHVNSLNASVSAAVILYEIYRKKNL